MTRTRSVNAFLNRMFLTAGTLLIILAGADAWSKEPRTDLYGDPLPPGAVARLGTARLRHVHAASLEFSSDGKRLISFSAWDGAVRIWDAASGKLIEWKRLPRKPASQEGFRETKLFSGGAMAAASDEGGLHLYDIPTGEERRRLRKARLDSTAQFSPDDKLLLSDKKLWDIAKGEVRHTLKLRELESFWVAAFAPDGKRLAAITTRKFSDDVEIRLWDTTSGREIGKKKLEHVPSESLAFSPDGKTLVVEYSGVRLLDASTLKEKAKLERERGEVIRGLRFSPNGQFLVGAYGGRDVWDSKPLGGRGVLLWDLKGKKKPRRLIEADVWARFAFTPDNKTLACADRYGVVIYLWDTASGRQLFDWSGHGKPVEALAVSPDGKLIASGASDAVYLWKTATGELLHKLSACDERNHICLFSPDGKQLISAGPGGALLVWDVASGKELRRFKVEGPNRGPVQVETAGISPDGKRLSAVFKVEELTAQLRVWELATGKQLAKRPYNLELRTAEQKFDDPPPLQPRDESRKAFTHVAFTPDCEVVSAWRPTRVGLEEVSTGRLLAALPKRVGRTIVVSPDGRFVAAVLLQASLYDCPYYGSECVGVSLSEAATGEEVFRVEIGDWEFQGIGFTPDSRGLIVVDRKCLRVWNVGTGERLHQMAWPQSIRNYRRGEVGVTSFAVLNDGRAVTGLSDGDVLVWDLKPASWPIARPAGNLGRKQVDALWSDLAADARTAHRALHTLTAAPGQAVSLFRERLQPAVAVDAKRVEKLLADLDSKQFATREAAVRELSALRERIEPTLREALRSKPTLEVSRRLKAILAEPLVPTLEVRRTLRAIALLERIGTPESRRLLEKLGGGSEARETRQAKAALERLNRR